MSPEDPLHIYAHTTKDITVRVVVHYVAHQSDPDEPRHVWSYFINIENNGPQSVQLLSRHWIITDGFGRVEEVKGDGVVGKQPHIAPGDSYDYSSGCALATASGTMYGCYHMVLADGQAVEAAIPGFSLHLPGAMAHLN